MTLRDLIDALGGNSWLPLVLFATLPVAGWALARAAGRDVGKTSLRFPLAVVVYLVCIPGILATVLTGYTLFFTHESLLDVNAMVYLLPLISMVVTLALIGRRVAFEQIPGFDRLSGLMVMIGLSFIVALALEKTRIWLFFGAPLTALVVIALVAFGLLKWSSHALFRRSDEAPKNPGDFLG